MKKIFVLLFAVAGVIVLNGCTLFQDDLYKAQAGQHNDNQAAVDEAIKESLIAEFGKAAVFRSGGEWQHQQWTAISKQYAVGLDKYRMRVHAYPQLDQDDRFTPVVICSKEYYSGASASAQRAGPKASQSRLWTEAGRDYDLEAKLANDISARLTVGNAGGQ
ncbi:MAG: hypothetical protein ACYTDT_04755 [Planctomycetota bacterium]